MSWLFSQALVEEFSEESSLDGEQCAPLSVMLTQHKFWHKGKTMEFSGLSRFGLTLQHLTESRGEELLKSFLEAFHVRTFPAQEKAQGLQDQEAGYGKSLPELLARHDLDSCSWKTVQCSLLEDLGLSLQTFPRWGLMLDGGLYLLPIAERPIKEIASGLLPTPSGVNAGKNHTMGRLDEWGGSSNIWRGTEIGKVRCASFEEWMMGWPTGWSALTQLETGKFHAWQQQHSGFYHGHN
jgi:hypothetical protein